ncbi:MAG: hypothetical protein LBS28_04365 [Streptococcaceae bacterium]|jgi:hypothetical protein|nr:hypothetical protein [Streptococcaceae bacterium]
MKRVIKCYAFFFLLGLFCSIDVFAKQYEKKEAALSLKDETSQKGQIYLAKDVTYAFEKIKSGNFKKSDFSEVNLEKFHLGAGVSFNSKKKTFTLFDFIDNSKKDSLTFGCNIKLDSKQVEDVLKLLFLTRQTYLEVLNDGKEKADREFILGDKHLAKAKVFKKHYYLVIDKAETKIPKIIYIKGEKNQLAFKKAKSNMQFRIESFGLTNKLDERKIVKNVYSANYGEVINYRLKIKIPKDSVGAIIKLLASHNLVIDQRTIQVEGLDSSKLNIEKKTKFSDKEPHIGSSLLVSENIYNLKNLLKEDNLSLETYVIKFSEDFARGDKKEMNISFSAILHNLYNYDIVIKNQNKFSEKKTIISEANPDLGYYVKAEVNFKDSSGEIIESDKVSSNVQSFGSNFFLYDGFRSKPIRGAKFALFRVGNNNQVDYVEYLDEHKDYVWQSMNYKIKNLARDVQVSGKAYQEFVENFKKKKITSYSFKNDKDPSTFYFRGLSTDYTYFLYQTEYVKDYVDSGKLWTFSSSNTSLTSAVQKYLGVSEYWPKKKKYEEFNCIYNLKQEEKLRQTYSGSHVKRYLLMVLIGTFIVVVGMVVLILKIS